MAELDRAKTAFFSNVSHEFRTPLTLMLGPVEDALAESDEPLPPLQRERMQVVHRNGLRLQRLVNNLLDFSRIEAGRVRASYEPTDLAAFTADLVSNFRAACEKAGLALSVDCPSLDALVFVDRSMWEKVVLNLLSNALKFTFEGRIAVTLRTVDMAAELRVQDTGTGIPAADIALLFDRFHRVENARGRTHEGSGIGLALVQELVKLHGGSITVESEIAQGTTFTVSIPLGSEHLPPDQVGSERTAVQPRREVSPFVEEAMRWLPEADLRPDAGSGMASAQLDPAAPAAPARSFDDDRPFVLVADDNADMRRYVVRLLADHCRTEAVPDGEAALAAARERTPDLVLTDVMMPRLDGFGLLQALRADPLTRGVPVIMLSARAGEESRVEGLEAGADDYLVKPFTARELVARVTAHLQMARTRREAGESIRASEERFRALVSATSDVIYRMSADWTEMHHLAGREFIADTHEPSRSWLVKYIPPEDRPHVLQVIDNAIRSKGVFELEHRVMRVDGTLGWTFSRAIPLLDGDGEIVEWFGAASDVTARKQAEEALRESEARIRAFADAAPAMLWETDPAGQCTFLSREWYSFTGQTEAQALGLGWTDATHPGDQAEASRIFLAANAGRDEFQIEYRLRGSHGGYRWALDMGRPRFAATGEYLGMVGVVIDIDERKHAEEALRASEDRRRLALDAAEVGMWHVDPATRAIKTDARFRAIFGTTEEWTDYWQLFAVMHPDDLPAVQEAVAAATRPDNPVPYAIEYRIVHPDGSLRWVFAKGRSRLEGTGPTRRVVSFDGTVADITDRKLGEEERERLVGRLREQDQRKDEFLATLAHELRNPLAPIRNGLQIMRLTTGDPQAIEQVRAMMERQLGQMVHLIDDLLDLSRISRGNIELRKERIELGNAIAQAVETSQPAIVLADHGLRIDMPPGPIHVDADLTRLAQVFSNLLNNAGKFTERGGQIRLTVQQLASEAVVSVRDNGIGISARMLPRVFEMFTQVEGNLERSQGGLGVGLSIVQRLVQMHGGSVEARSDGLGSGSEFVVRLPVASSLLPDRAPERAESVHPVGRHRILVVDDNRDAADSLAMMLTMMGNETLTAYDGSEALDVASTFRPDVMFLDIGMPKLNGYEVCRRIRREAWAGGMVVIALTGWGQEEDKRLSLEAGFDSHLVKPILPGAIEKLLADAAAKGV